MGEILKHKSLSFLLTGFGCLMIVAGFFQVDDITKFKVTVMAHVAWRPVGGGTVLILCALNFEWLKGRANNADVQEIPSRDDYINEIIKQVEHTNPREAY